MPATFSLYSVGPVSLNMVRMDHQNDRVVYPKELGLNRYLNVAITKRFKFNMSWNSGEIIRMEFVNSFYISVNYVYSRFVSCIFQPDTKNVDLWESNITQISSK